MEIAPGHECSCKINYLKCNDSSKWCQNVPAYEKIVYKNLWNNIDLVFSSVKGQLKYEFIINSGASADDIKLSYIGGDSISLDNEGNLIINTALGSFTDKKPLTYQMIENKKVIIDSSFILKAENMFSFEVDGNYDKNNTLVIDPSLEYSTYLGGDNLDFGFGIAVDSNSNAYVTGTTYSENFPTTPNAYQPVDPDSGPVFSNAFITKINTKKTGNASLVYSTYLGGNSFDEGLGIAIDKSDNAYITGYTESSDFPTTCTAYQRFDPDLDFNAIDGFITKINTASVPLFDS